MGNGIGLAAAFSPSSPMGYLETFGPRADPATALTWGLTVISIAVSVIVTLLVVAGILVRRTRGATAEVRVQQGASGLSWLYVGLALTVATLIVSLIWTVRVLAEVDSPVTRPALTIEVTGVQWWWAVRYPGAHSGERFSTANEIHIPAGRPVLLKLTGADVIHSFWIPALSGKTDTIPGRVNVAWLQADRAGVYRGQCTEYCGRQHAHMAAYVIADPPAVFEAWRRAQMQAAPAPASPETIAGEAVFVHSCGACHAVRGTAAMGASGPDLTHLMSRSTIAAGTLPNTMGALSGWIEDAPALKPGTRMPASYLTPKDLAAVRAYLETLK